MASAVRIYGGKPVGVKWSNHLERVDLEEAIAALPPTDRRKVGLVFV